MAKQHQFYKKFKLGLFWLLLVISLMPLDQAQAGILISTSRVIFQGDQQEQFITIANTNQYAVLVHLWIDNGLGKLDTADNSMPDVPFLTVPVIFRLDPHKTTSARIISNGQNLSTNQEQLFWINIYEVPAVNQTLMNSDHLQLAIHTQLKLIYRPVQLNAPDWNSVFKNLHFKYIPDDDYLTISIENQSPYIVNLSGLNLIIENKRIELANEDDNTLMPFSTKQYRSNLKTVNRFNSSLAQHKIELNIIDDHGSISSYRTVIKNPESL